MHRLTAFLLAFACLWISGGATLHHTDDIASLLTFHTTRSALSHSAADLSPDLCLACQWENAAFDSQVPVVPSIRPLLVALPHLLILPEQHPSIAFGRASPRAPPACAL